MKHLRLTVCLEIDNKVLASLVTLLQAALVLLKITGRTSKARPTALAS